jgi:hypothetical protein
MLHFGLGIHCKNPYFKPLKLHLQKLPRPFGLFWIFKILALPSLDFQKTIVYTSVGNPFWTLMQQTPSLLLLKKTRSKASMSVFIDLNFEMF